MVSQLTTGTRSGTLTVAGTTTSAATNVTVNGQTATRYGDNTFAREGFALSDGNNTFTAIAQDSLGRGDTNAVTVNLPATVNFAYDQNGNLTTDGRRTFAYGKGSVPNIDTDLAGGWSLRMPRKPRVEYPGAIYHVMNRGDRREPILKDDEDRRCFLETLGQACGKTGWQVHAYLR
jgi:hypothetical protein